MTSVPITLDDGVAGAIGDVEQPRRIIARDSVWHVASPPQVGADVRDMALFTSSDR